MCNVILMEYLKYTVTLKLYFSMVFEQFVQRSLISNITEHFHVHCYLTRDFLV